jgi:hypothetical protein
LAEESDQNNPWIAEPLTDEKTRKEKSKEMRTRMELMILKVPVNVINEIPFRMASGDSKNTFPNHNISRLRSSKTL